MSKLNTYRVIGLYESDGEVFTEDVQATDEAQAMAGVAADKMGEDLKDALIIGAIIPTTSKAIKFATPADDNWKAAYVEDLVTKFWITARANTNLTILGPFYSEQAAEEEMYLLGLSGEEYEIKEEN
jgi:hypothetical protein